MTGSDKPPEDRKPAQETPFDEYDDLGDIADPGVRANLARLATLERAFQRVRDRHDAGRSGDTETFDWCHLHVHECIGRGGFGKVYRAFDADLGREVALKLRREDRSPAEDMQVLAEARRLARVRHPNVLAIHGANVDQGRAGIWCDLLEGETLETRLERDGPLALDEFLRLALPLSEALDAIHAAHLVHGDLKADNVMLQPAGAPALMDFGAGVVSDERDQPAEAGSPLVMAPEWLAGAPLAPAGDVYSLGVLFFRLLTGRYPHATTRLETLRERHQQHAEIDWRGVDRRGIPGPLRQLLRSMLAHDPARRPTASGVGDALQAVIERPKRQRRQAAVGIIIGALVLGTVLATLGYLRASEAEREARAAEAASAYSLDFVQRFLTSPRAREKGNEVRVVELLEDARRELALAPPATLLRQAAIASLLGSTYDELGQHDVAEELLRQALSAYETADCRCEDEWSTGLAMVRNAIHRGAYEDARTRLGQISQAVEKHLASTHPLQLDVARVWADLEGAAGSPEAADRALVRALGISEGLAEPGLTPGALRTELAAHRLRSDPAGAEAMAREAREWLETHSDENATVRTDAEEILARILIERGSPQDAEAVLRQAYTRESQRAPEGSRRVLRLLSTLGIALTTAGKQQEALAVNAEALEIALRVSPQSHDALSARLNYAVALQELGYLEDARKGYEDALDDASSWLDPSHDTVLIARANLAEVLLLAEAYDAATQQATEALAASRSALGDDHLITLFSASVLGASLARQGQPEPAIELLEATLARKTAQFGRENPYTQDTVLFLAEALAMAGNNARARDLFDEVIDSRTRLYGASHAKTMEAQALKTNTAAVR